MSAWGGLTFTLMTVREPTSEQMPMNTNMLVVPCTGAAQKIRYPVITATNSMYKTKPRAPQEHKHVSFKSA